MDAKRTFPLYAWMTAGLLLITSFTLPGHFDIPYPAPVGPEFDAAQKIGPQQYLELHKPALVLIGDSQLYLGVDPEQLSRNLGVETYQIAVPGSGSAVWYLLMKNSLAESMHVPELVVITFRDTLLTLPGYRVTGRYFDLVDDYARKTEPVLLERAYLNQLNGLETAAERYVPLFSARREIREGLDRDVRYGLPRLAGCDEACVDDGIEAVFGRERLDPAALSSAVDAAQQSMFTPEAFDFDGQVERSLLPEIIRIADERGIRLVFVRLKTLIYPTLATEPPAMRMYMRALEAYLAARGAEFLDFSHDERLISAYFFDEMHFTTGGAQAFTDLLAQGLQPILRP